MGVSNPFSFEAGLAPRVAVTECQECPRLVAWRECQADRVPPRFRTLVDRHGFWARPVEAFGDPQAWLAIVGLAPAAQGANRTGRIFTGDRSGEFLFAALHRAGLASAPVSSHRGDGLALAGAVITAALRCAPPGNRPTAEELARCRVYLRHDLATLPELRVVLALGRVAHAAVLALFPAAKKRRLGEIAFSHGAARRLPGGAWLVDSYHVSQQNTFTGRLTPAMFDTVLERCQALRDESGAGRGGD